MVELLESLRIPLILVLVLIGAGYVWYRRRDTAPKPAKPAKAARPAKASKSSKLLRRKPADASRGAVLSDAALSQEAFRSPEPIPPPVVPAPAPVSPRPAAPSPAASMAMGDGSDHFIAQQLAAALIGAGRIWRAVEQSGGLANQWPAGEGAQLSANLTTISEIFRMRADAAAPAWCGAPSAAENLTPVVAELSKIAAHSPPDPAAWTAAWLRFRAGCEEISRQESLRGWIAQNRPA